VREVIMPSQLTTKESRLFTIDHITIIGLVMIAAGKIRISLKIVTLRKG